MCEPPSSQINRLKIIERNNLPFLVHSFSIRNLVRSFGVDAFQRGSKRKMLMKEKRRKKIIIISFTATKCQKTNCVFSSSFLSTLLRLFS